MTVRSSSLKFLTLLVALMLVIAACGGDDDATDDSPTTTESASGTTEAMADTTEAATETTEAATETTAGGDAAGECAVADLPLFEAGKLTIATGDPVFPPWMMDDDPTNGEGYESAVAYALAEQMGFAAGDVTWVRTGFDEAIAPGDKPYDFNMQQYSITEDRAEIVDFSMSYYQGRKSVLATSDSAANGATSFEELGAATWGATIGTTDLDYIENVLGIDDVAVYNTQADTISAMNAGQIDATVVDLSSAFYLSAVELEDTVIAAVLPETPDSGDGMGLLFTKGNELVPCVDAAIQALWDDGTIDAIAEEWLQSGGDTPEITG